MVLGVSSYITSAGLKAITSAGSSGPYFAIKYFVPIYNYRTDKTICKGYTAGTSALSISGLNLVSATDSSLNSQFEKIYKNGNYTLSTTQNFIYNEGLAGVNNGGTSNITGSKLTVSTKTNTLNGSPLSNVVSGATVSTNTSGNFTVTNTTTAAAVSFNPLSASSVPLSAFYRVTSYSPVSNGITSASGSFKCKIPAGNGSFKFNGLALYGAKVDSHGFDDNGSGISPYAVQPTLFGIVLFDEAQTKQDAVGGVNDFEIKVNLGFDWTTYNASGASPVYIETNYWAKMPIASTTSADALSYDGDIVISSSAVPGSWTPRAKLTVTDKDKQQLRIGKDLLKFADFQIKTYGLGDTSATGLDTDLTVLSIDTACPDDSLLELGYKTSASALKSVAIGCYAKAYGYQNPTSHATETDAEKSAGGYTTSIGIDTSAGGFASFAIGQETHAYGYGCFAGGYNSVAIVGTDVGGNYNPTSDAGFNFAYGYGASAISDGSDCNNGSFYLSSPDLNTKDHGANISMGQETYVFGSHSMAFGFKSSAYGQGAIAIGRHNKSNGCYSTTIGVSNYAIGSGSLAFGMGAVADPSSSSTGAQATSIGLLTSALGGQSLAMGYKSLASNFGSIAIGNEYKDSFGNMCYARAIGNNSIAIGSTSAISDESIAIGTNTLSNAFGATSIGYKTSAIGNFSVAIGTESIATNGQSVAIGNRVVSKGYESMAIGLMTSALGNNSFAGGFSSKATGYMSFVYGSFSNSNDNSVTLGNKNTAENSSFVIGHDSYVTGTSGMSYGYNNSVTDCSASIAIGNGINITTDDTISIGSSLSIINVDGKTINIGSDKTDVMTLRAKRVIIEGGAITPILGIKAYFIRSNGRGKKSTIDISSYNNVTGSFDICHIYIDHNNGINNNIQQCINLKSNSNYDDCSLWIDYATNKIIIAEEFVNDKTNTDLSDYDCFLLVPRLIKNTWGVAIHSNQYVNHLNVHILGGNTIPNAAVNVLMNECKRMAFGKLLYTNGVSPSYAKVIGRVDKDVEGDQNVLIILNGYGASNIWVNKTTNYKTGWFSSNNEDYLL